MKTILTIISVTFIFFSCTNNKKKSENYFALAKGHYERESYKIADSLCNLSIFLDSNNLKAIILKAKLKNIEKNYDDAIIILKNILKYEQSKDTIYFLIGSNYYEIIWENRNNKGKEENKEIKYWSLAKTYYDSALKINPYYYKAYLNKSNAFHNQDDYINSMITLNKAISLFPDSIDLIYNRGIAKIYLGDKDGAIKDLQGSISSGKLDSVDMAVALRFMSNIYSGEENFDAAISILTTAIKFNPKDYLLFAVRGSLYIKINKKDSACSDFRKAADLGFINIYSDIEKYCN